MTFILQFEKVDALYDEEGKYSEIYNQLKKADQTDAGVLWRLARACYQMASPLEMKNPKKKELLDEGFFSYSISAKNNHSHLGYKYSLAAQKLKPDDYFVVSVIFLKINSSNNVRHKLKWLAALTGSRTDFLGTKEKIQQGNVFKALLDRCLGMKPDDYAVCFK
jgi:hypothetical protein